MGNNKSGWFGLKQIRSWWSNWQWSKDPTFNRFFNNHFFNSSTPVLIDSGTQNIIKVYQDCPHLRAVIDKRGELFSNGQWKCYKIGTGTDEQEEITEDEGLKLLKKPNVFQSGEDLLKDYLYNKDLYANNFIYKLSGSVLVLPKALWNLPSEWMEIEFTGKFFDQIELDGIIKKFIFCYSGTRKEYTAKDVMYKPERFSITEGKGTSKIPTLQLPVSNIIAALKTRNILAVSKGVVGFMSSDSKDVNGTIPIQDTERKMIEEEFAKDTDLYSDRPKVKIVNQMTKWNHMSYPVKDLMLFEEVEDDFNTILAAFGLRREIFPTTSGSTYENQNQAEKSAYTSTIQPEADAFAAMITTMLRGEERGVKYVLDYGWLPIMQEDKLNEANIDLINQTRLSALFADGIIGADKYAELADVKMTGTGTPSGASGGSIDSLGKIPLALQQLALARERAVTAGDTDLINQLGKAQDALLMQLAKMSKAK